MRSGELECELGKGDAEVRCLVARRQDTLEKVKAECEAFGLNASRILLVPANITSTDDLLRVREEVIKGGIHLISTDGSMGRVGYSAYPRGSPFDQNTHGSGRYESGEIQESRSVEMDF